MTWVLVILFLADGEIVDKLEKRGSDGDGFPTREACEIMSKHTRTLYMSRGLPDGADKIRGGCVSEIEV